MLHPVGPHGRGTDDHILPPVLCLLFRQLVWMNTPCSALQSTVKPRAVPRSASTQTVTVDGKAVEFQMYALKDANGNDTNYVKLRGAVRRPEEVGERLAAIVFTANSHAVHQLADIAPPSP